MFGGPGETKETVRETLAFANECVRDTDAAFFNVGIRIYPGTPLERVAREDGVLRIPAGEMLAPVFYVSLQVELKWLVRELREAANRNMNFISQDTFTLPYLPGLLAALQRLGVSQPVWRHTGRLRRGLHFLGVRT